jgi:hypothetical protein
MFGPEFVALNGVRIEGDNAFVAEQLTKTGVSFIPQTQNQTVQPGQVLNQFSTNDVRV